MRISEKESDRRKRFSALSERKVKQILNVHADTYVLQKKTFSKRNREIVESRAQWFYFLYRYTKLSLARIGKMFEKDHASVLHALNNYDVYIQYNPKLKDAHNKIDLSLKTISERQRRKMEYLYGGGQIDDVTDVTVIRQRRLISILLKEYRSLRSENMRLKAEANDRVYKA